MPAKKKRNLRKDSHYVPKRNMFKKYRSTSIQNPIKGRSMPGFAAQKTYKLRYNDYVYLNPGAATVPARHMFRANGINDPDVTGTGHQPLGKDELAVFWNHGIVTGSKLTADFCKNQTVENFGPSSVVGIYVADDATVPATTSAMLEQGLSKWNYLSDGTNNGKDMVRVTNTYSARKFFNISDIKDNVDRLGQNLTGGTPAEEAYYHVFAAGIDPLYNPGAILVNITIEYTVIVSEPKTLSQS